MQRHDDGDIVRHKHHLLLTTFGGTGIFKSATEGRDRVDCFPDTLRAREYRSRMLLCVSGIWRTPPERNGDRHKTAIRPDKPRHSRSFLVPRGHDVHFFFDVSVSYVFTIGFFTLFVVA